MKIAADLKLGNAVSRKEKNGRVSICKVDGLLANIEGKFSYPM